MATGVRVAITLACTDCKRRNYQSQKSKRNSPDRVSRWSVWLPHQRQYFRSSTRSGVFRFDFCD